MQAPIPIDQSLAGKSLDANNAPDSESYQDTVTMILAFLFVVLGIYLIVAAYYIR